MGGDADNMLHGPPSLKAEPGDTEMGPQSEGWASSVPTCLMVLIGKLESVGARADTPSRPIGKGGR